MRRRVEAPPCDISTCAEGARLGECPATTARRLTATRKTRGRGESAQGCWPSPLLVFRPQQNRGAFCCWPATPRLSLCVRSKVVRKSIARVLTVINQTQKAQLRVFYKDKKQLPLDLRPPHPVQIQITVDAGRPARGSTRSEQRGSFLLN